MKILRILIAALAIISFRLSAQDQPIDNQIRQTLRNFEEWKHATQERTQLGEKLSVQIEKQDKAKAAEIFKSYKRARLHAQLAKGALDVFSQVLKENFPKDFGKDFVLEAIREAIEKEAPAEKTDEEIFERAKQFIRSQ